MHDAPASSHEQSAAPAPADELLSAFLQRPGTACPRCRYDLTGLDAATCPECGHHLRLVLAGSRVRGALAPTISATFYIAAGPPIVFLVFAALVFIDGSANTALTVTAFLAALGLGLNVWLAEVARHATRPLLAKPRRGATAVLAHVSAVFTVVAINIIYWMLVLAAASSM